MPQRNNMAAAFARHVADDPTADALVVGDDRWSRAEIADFAARATATLIDLGAQPGDTVVAQYGTRASDLAVALAAARLGCTFIPIPHRLGAYEFNYILELAQPILLAVHEEGLAEKLDIPARTTVLNADRLLEADPVDVPVAEEPADHVALVGFTSGSTGRPKGVMHRWSSMDWTTAFLASVFDHQVGEPICVTGAGAGAPGFTFFTYFGLTRGAPIVTAERWDPARVLELMHREQTVWSTMVPTMLYQMLEVADAEPATPKPTAMRAVSMGGAFMSESLIQRARSVLGLEVLRVYAMAECMMNCHMRLSDPEQDRDVQDGWPGPGDEVGVFENDGVTHARVGDIGEFGLKGASLFEGYLGDPETKPSRSTPDGYFLSGDMGKITAEGYVKVVGRKKDLIIRGGFNIDPVEVEELIRQFDRTRDVAVVGYADEKFGERACAFVLVHPGDEFELDELAAVLLEFGLSKEKLPERLICITDMPRSPDGKILKGELRDRLAADS